MSGVPSGHGGAGDYLKIIQCRYPQLKYYSPKENSNKYGGRYLGWIRLTNRLINKLTILSLLFKSANSTVHIYHVQSIGYILSSLLIFKFKRVIYWHLDSSYFCIASYNYLDGHGTCLKCLDFNYRPTCRAFPINVSLKIYRVFRIAVKRNVRKLTVVLQSDRNKALFEQCYGVSRFRLEPMVTDQVLKLIENKGFETSVEKSLIVFHGNFLGAKGSVDFLKLANEMPDWRFVVPGKKPTIGIFPDNLEFMDVTWDTGLQEICRRAEWIFVASDWSAPVEASVLKSVLCGRPLIVRSSSSSAVLGFSLTNIVDLSDGMGAVVKELRSARLRSAQESLGDRENVVNYIRMGNI